MTRSPRCAHRLTGYRYTRLRPTRHQRRWSGCCCGLTRRRQRRLTLCARCVRSHAPDPHGHCMLAPTSSLQVAPAPSIGGLFATAAGLGEERKRGGGGGTATDLSRGRGHNGFIVASHLCRKACGGQSIIGVPFGYPRQRCAATCSKGQQIGGQTEGEGA